MGPAYLAIYAFALVIPDQLAVLITTVTDVIIPKLGENNQHSIQLKIKEKAWFLIAVNIILITIVILLTPLAIKILFTENYAESILYSQIITGSLFVYVFEVIYSRILVVKKRKAEIFKTNVAMSIFRGIAIVISFIWFGLLGVAISSIIARLFNLVMYLYYGNTASKSGD